MKNLADASGHIVDAAPPFFGWEQPERRVALWIQVDDQDPFVMVRCQTGTNMNGIRGLTDASFEIDKRDYLAHGVTRDLNQANPESRDEQRL